MTKRLFVLMTLRSFIRAPVASSLLVAQVVVCTLALSAGLSLSHGEQDRVKAIETRLDGVVYCSPDYHEQDGLYVTYDVTYDNILAADMDRGPGVIVHLGFVENDDHYYTVEAVNPEYVALVGLGLSSGCWPWESPITGETCVLTAELAGILFGTEDPLGRQIDDTIVVGVLEPGAAIPGAVTTPHSRILPGATVRLFCCMNGKLVQFIPNRHRQPELTDIWFDQGHDLDTLLLSLQRQLDIDHPPVRFVSWFQYISMEAEQRRQLTTALNSSSFQLFAASAFGMMGLMALTIPRRRSALALELALGATPRQLAARMVAEYLVLSGISIMMAAVLYAAARLIVERIDATIIWSLSSAVWVPILAAHVLLAVVACALPVAATLRLSPRRALDGG